jgi:hypothetical protein
VKYILAIACVCVISCGLYAQVVDTTVCDILKNPQSFDGKIVRIKGTVTAGFDQFMVKGPGCGQHVDGIWLSYPEGTRSKSGPAAILQLQPARNFAGTVTAVNRNPVTLESDKDFKQFDSLLSTSHKGGGMCLGCMRYEVSATLVGRLDGVGPTLRRDNTNKIVEIRGFGNLNAYSARLVLKSVSDVSPQEIDFSKPAAAGNNNSTTTTPEPTPDLSANAASDQVRRAADAFGKPGEDNGVAVGFGGLNEADPNVERKSEHDSPDGVLWNCAFDSTRVKGDAMSLAIAHMGEHIADLRNPQPGTESPSLYALEYRAWTTTALSAVANRQKNLMVPGGYTLWPLDSKNPPNNTLADFLANEELLAQ